MRVILILLLAISIPLFCQQKPFPKLAFGKNALTFYIGSGAVSRHVDWTRFEQETETYNRSPFLCIGFDKCILPFASNAYWGIGLYGSLWFANRAYNDVNDNLKKNTWSNTLIAVRVSHHNSYYVREKLDMCSGFLIGTRIKYYHSKTINEKVVINNNDKTTLYPAFGLTFTIRYYVYKNIGLYADGCLGYKTDLASIGIIYKI